MEDVLLDYDYFMDSLNEVLYRHKYKSEHNQKLKEEFIDLENSTSDGIFLARMEAKNKESYISTIETLIYSDYSKHNKRRFMPSRERYLSLLHEHLADIGATFIDNEGKEVKFGDVFKDREQFIDFMGDEQNINLMMDRAKDSKTRQKIRNLFFMNSTAYITEMGKRRGKSDPLTLYFTGLSEDLVKKLSEEHGFNFNNLRNTELRDLPKKALDKLLKVGQGIQTALAHEMLHDLRGDLRNKERYGLDHNRQNIVQDSEINARVILKDPKVAEMLFSVLGGVKADTIHKFTPEFYLADALKRNKDFDHDKILTDYAQHLVENEAVPEGTTVDKLKKKLIENGYTEEIVSKLHNNVQEKGDVGKIIERVYNRRKDKYDRMIKNGDISESLFDKNQSFKDLLNTWQTHLTDYQEGRSPFYLEDFFGEVLKEVADLVGVSKEGQGKGNGSGGSGKGTGGGSGKGTGSMGEGLPNPMDEDQNINDKIANTIREDDDAFIRQSEFDEKDVIRRSKAKAKAQRGTIRRKASEITGDTFDGSGGVGGGGVEIDTHALKKKGVRKIADNIKSFIRKVNGGVQDIIEQRLNPGYSQNVIHEEGGTVQYQKGVMTAEMDKKHIKNVMFVSFDESGSVSDDMLSLAKSTVLDMCVSENRAVIALSEDSGGNPTVSVYHPSMGEAGKEAFLKRDSAGGTPLFHDFVYDLKEKLNANNGELKEKINKELEKAKIPYKDKDGKTETLNADHLIEMFEEGQITGAVFTDGGLYGQVDAKPEYKEQRNKYKGSYPPLVYIIMEKGEIPFYNIFKNLSEKESRNFYDWVNIPQEYVNMFRGKE